MYARSDACDTHDMNMMLILHVFIFMEILNGHELLNWYLSVFHPNMSGIGCICTVE